MSKKYYATNGRDYWKPNPAYKEERLALLDNGQLVILTNMVRDGWVIFKLPEEYIYTEIPPENEVEEKVEKIECINCSGTGETMQIVDHDADYNSVWATCQCDRCNGTGLIIKK